MYPQPAESGTMPQTAPTDRVVPDDEKKLAGDWQKRIESALKRVENKFKTFKQGRRRLAALVGESETEVDRAPLHFANMAALLPQVYAKDPEFAAKPTRAVSNEMMAAAKAFAQTAEFMLQKVVVKDGGLKKQAKKQIRSCYATSVGWIKASWQEKKAQDPLIANRIKDTQDNIERVQQLLAQSQDPQACTDHELTLAKLQEAIAGLQEAQQEVTVAKGIALDFVMSEDILIIDASVRSIGDYPRAGAIAHRVWMTAEQYERTFGYRPKKAKSYSEQGAGAMAAANTNEQTETLVCVWEIWSQDDNRLFYVCDGEEGFCKPPSSVDWTGKRWYPFFLVAFNEIDGSFYPLSDIELTDKLVKEYNESREDFVRDRKECLPVNVVRKGGTLTPDDVERLKNRKGSDWITVEGVGQNPLTNDIFTGQLGKLDPASYDTSASRQDMEKVLGGSDTSTGSITRAKTATEAEILSQGLRSRAGERQDIMEDMLNELGPYCLEVMLRKYTEVEVKKLAGEQAVWPQLEIEEIFNLVTIEVRGGSTGKPDRLQEQDRWTKLLPIINEAVAKVAELREQGQEALAQAVIELTRETLRRFDERLDIEQFLPKQPDGEQDPNMLMQQNAAMKRQVQELMQRLKEATEKVEKGYISAAASISTCANPPLAAATFTQLLGMPMPEAPAAMGIEQPGEPMDVPGQPEEPDPIPQPQAAPPQMNDAIPPQPPVSPVPQP